jgi:TPR repeat protein
VKYLSAQGNAAFTLSNIYLHGFGVQKSVDRAGYWLSVAAKHGSPLAMALSAKMQLAWRIQISADERRRWLHEAAKNGSKPALRQLKSEDFPSYQICQQHHRTLFWAQVYNVP